MKKSFKQILFLIIYFLLSLSNSNLFAQRDSFLEYFPLHKGDLHQFHYQYSYWSCGTPDEWRTHSSYHEEKVLGDTILPTGFNYKIINSNMPEEPSLYYLRIDTIKANVYRYEDYPIPHDILIDSLFAEIGDSFVSEGWTENVCVKVDSTTVIGVPTVVKHFIVHFIPGAEFSLAYGLGRIYYETVQDDGCYPMHDYFDRNIVFAKINGKEYGTYVGVSEQSKSAPIKFVLGQNYPNPFNSSTTIKYELPEGKNVHLIIYNILGKKIDELVNTYQKAGIYKINWEAKNITSGVYFYTITAGSFRDTKKLILLK